MLFEGRGGGGGGGGGGVAEASLRLSSTIRVFSSIFLVGALTEISEDGEEELE